MSTEPTYCKRHPKEETTLRCSRCEDPICPKCAVLTTVGYRCPSCGKAKSATASVPLRTMILSGGSGFALGFISSILVPSIIGFFVIFLGAIVGGFIGEIVSRVSGRKRSLGIAIITGSGFVFGALFFFARDIVELMNAGLTIAEAISVSRFPLWPMVYAIVASLAAGARLTW